MILTLLVQYNYNGTISIAEPIGSKLYDYYEIATAKTLKEAKDKAYKHYEGTNIKLVFIDDEGDEL